MAQKKTSHTHQRQPAREALPIESQSKTTDATQLFDQTPKARETPKDLPVKRMKVRATQTGYYGDVLRRVGDVFVIEGQPRESDPAGPPRFYSRTWMEPADLEDPETTTTNNEVLRREHEQLRATKAERGQSVGDDTTTDRRVIE